MLGADVGVLGSSMAVAVTRLSPIGTWLRFVLGSADSSPHPPGVLPVNVQAGILNPSAESGSHSFGAPQNPF